MPDSNATDKSNQKDFDDKQREKLRRKRKRERLQEARKRRLERGSTSVETVKKAVRARKNPVKRGLGAYKQQRDREQNIKKQQFLKASNQVRNRDWSKHRLTDAEKAQRVQRMRTELDRAEQDIERKKQEIKKLEKEVEKWENYSVPDSQKQRMIAQKQKMIADRESDIKKKQEFVKDTKKTLNKAEEQAAKDKHLNKDEIAGVCNYTGSRYKRMNALLRGDYKTFEENLQPGETMEEALASTRQDIELANSSLDKLPAYQGEDGKPPIVHRGSNLPPEVVDKYEPGQEVTEEAFTSTSTAAESAYQKNTKFEIYSKNGKEIKNYSQYPNEKEVVFPPGTKFKVLEKTTDKDGNVHIKMVEVEED
ncbi:MAG: hypothetical protein F6J87_13815 [Spirulina sp. SIO3F2]|nr:hypothetical protein [Spirulina sp. SIO3F2]